MRSIAPIDGPRFYRHAVVAEVKPILAIAASRRIAPDRWPGLRIVGDVAVNLLQSSRQFWKWIGDWRGTVYADSVITLLPSEGWSPVVGIRSLLDQEAGDVWIDRPGPCGRRRPTTIGDILTPLSPAVASCASSSRDSRTSFPSAVFQRRSRTNSVFHDVNLLSFFAVGAGQCR